MNLLDYYLDSYYRDTLYILLKQYYHNKTSLSDFKVMLQKKYNVESVHIYEPFNTLANVSWIFTVYNKKYFFEFNRSFYKIILMGVRNNAMVKEESVFQ